VGGASEQGPERLSHKYRGDHILYWSGELSGEEELMSPHKIDNRVWWAYRRSEPNGHKTTQQSHRDAINPRGFGGKKTGHTKQDRVEWLTP